MRESTLILSKKAEPFNGHCPTCGVAAVTGKLLCGCRERPLQPQPAPQIVLTDVDAPLETESAVAYSTDATLRRKQQYYVYSERPYRFKEPPELSRELLTALKRERLDKTYRFVWGGVVVVREQPNADTFTIARGHKTACHDVGGIFMPKYIFARARQARGYYYINDLQQKVAVTREEFVPPGKLALVDYRYVDFGLLRWFLEQRTNADTLIKTRVYDPKEHVPESEWLCIMPLETRNGLYYEPGLEMIDVLKKREWENESADLRQVAAAQIARNEKARLEEARKEDEQGHKDFDLVYRDATRSAEKQTAYSI